MLSNHFRLITTLLSLLTLSVASAVETTLISPYYFGPNAFPIPEIVDRTSSVIKIEGEANYFRGRRDDHTTDFTLRAVIPLWTSRANLSIWLPVMEWYRNSDKFLQACNILPPYTEDMHRGHLTGDVYVSTDLHILLEKRYRPDLVIRAGLKTASGGGSGMARYYDSPGYFFDATFGKTFSFLPGKSLKLRVAAEGGFLCWQTSVDRQNDAVMFGIKVRLSYLKVSFSETFAGYTGWEHISSSRPELAHDSPMSFKSRFEYQITGHWALHAVYEHGLTDYPYNHFALGVAYSIPILK